MLRCRWPKISIRSVHSARAVRTKPFRESVHTRAARRDLHSVDPGVLQDRVEGCGELPSPVTDQEQEPRGAVTEVHQQVPDLLGSPEPVRVCGHSEDVHLPAADLDDEEAVQALERDGAIDMEEIAGEHRGGLRSKEPPPCGAGIPLRRGRYLQLPEDPADARGAHLVAELQQLALDPDEPSGEPAEDQVQQAYRHGRPSCPSARPLPDLRVTATGRLLTPRKVTRPTCCCSRRGHATTRVAATRGRARLSADKQTGGKGSA